MISSTILAILSLIESIIPMFGTSSAAVSTVSNVINVLTKLMPLIVNEISSVYTATKNIIAQLTNSGAPTADQITALQTLDAQVDAAWNAVQAQIDPDIPGGVQ